jgi:hypothetical protein
MSQESAPPLPKPVSRLPLWAKILAAVSATFILLGAVLGVSSIVWMRKLFLDAVNPVYITSTLKRIADFPDATFAALHPQVAIRLPGVPVLGTDICAVAFAPDANQMQFDLASYQAEDSDPDPKDVIDFLYDRPPTFCTITCRCESIVDKGTLDISGHRLFYQTVVLKSVQDVNESAPVKNNGAAPGASPGASPGISPGASPGASAVPAAKESAAQETAAKEVVYKGVIGCMVVGRKVIVLEAACPQDRTLDINILGDLLRKARSF